MNYAMNDSVKSILGKLLGTQLLVLMVFLSKSVLFIFLIIANSASANDSPQVVASIKPIQLLVNEIIGLSDVKQSLQPALLLNENQNHHLHALRPSQRILLSKARYVFYISDEFDAYMKAIKQADRVPENVFKYIELGKLEGIRLLSIRHNGDISHTYIGDDKSEPDWHIWLNPDNAIVMLAKIRDIFIELDPNQSQQYQRNYDNAVIRITAQSRRVAEKMMQVMKTAFLTLHDGYQYFEEQYGLKSMGSILHHHDEKTSIKRVVEARKLIKTYNIRCVFKNSRFSSKTLSPVIEGFDVQLVNLDATGAAGDVQLKSYTDLVDQFSGIFYSSLISDSNNR